jgi:UDP-2,3-diacylglucosamine pyrophosphatase LpxH
VDSVLFITGNHDNWTLGYFSSLGFDVEQDFRIIELSNTQTFLMHGDGLMNGKGTLTRPLVHQILRNKNFLTLYRAIFRNGLGLGLMRLFSNLTRSFERVNPVRLSTNAHWILEHLPVQTVICGHDHIPRTEKTDSGLYINTGAFFQHKTVARYVDGAYTLVQWNADTQTFTPFSQLVHEY